MRYAIIRSTPGTLAIFAATCTVLTTLTVLTWTTVNSAEPGIENRAGSITAPMRHREGTTLSDRIGTIRHSGERIHFRLTEGSLDFRLLENLTLERVLRTIEESKTDRLWSLSGTVTEFQGENYLLLNRAVLTSKQPPKRESGSTPASPQ